MALKLSKTQKRRGSRTYGYSRVGQYRGSGTKGKRKSGYDKHGWTYLVKYEPNYYGKRDFTSHRSLGQTTNVVNTGEIVGMADKLVREGRLEKIGRKRFLDLEKLGHDKLLAAGSVAAPFIVKIPAYSEAAEKNLEKAGGRILKKT